MMWTVLVHQTGEKTDSSVSTQRTLSTRLAENLERTRAGGMNKEQTQKGFDTLEKVKALCVRLNREEELAPSLLYNLDEAGVDQVWMVTARLLC